MVVVRLFLLGGIKFLRKKYIKYLLKTVIDIGTDITIYIFETTEICFGYKNTDDIKICSKIKTKIVTGTIFL